MAHPTINLLTPGTRIVYGSGRGMQQKGEGNMSLGPHMCRVHLSLSKSLRAVLDEVGRQDHRSLSNLIEHGMREWVSVEINMERYRHLETGPIQPPGPYRPNPDATRQNRAPVAPTPPARKNQFKDGTYSTSPEGRKYAAIGERIRANASDKNTREP